MDKTCGTCRWWRAEHVRNARTLYRRECHRFPQIVNKVEDDFCGEHQDKEPPHAG